MGYDFVDYKCKCPMCGEKLVGFRSKDRDCDLELISVSEVNNFYDECLDCETWLKFDRITWRLFKMTYGSLWYSDENIKLVYIRQ